MFVKQQSKNIACLLDVNKIKQVKLIIIIYQKKIRLAKITMFNKEIKKIMHFRKISFQDNKLQKCWSEEQLQT